MASPSIDLRAVVRRIVQEELAAMLADPQDLTKAGEPRRRRPMNRDTDYARRFIEDCCIQDPAAEVSHEDLHRRYIEWCERHHTHPRSQIGLAKALGALGYVHVKVERKGGRRGRRLR